MDVPLSLAMAVDVSGSQQHFNEDHRRDMKEFRKMC
jgi:hypothetical protein